MYPALPGNYCPIPNLPLQAKIVDRKVTAQLQTHLELYKLLDPMQSGFLPGYSTETTVACVQDDILRGVDSGGAVALLLLDLSVAFNTINYGIMIQRLQSVAKMSG